METIVTSDDKLDLILERLTALERQIADVSDTADRAEENTDRVLEKLEDFDHNEVVRSIDGLYDLITQADQRRTLDEIRRGYRSGAAS